MLKLFDFHYFKQRLKKYPAVYNANAFVKSKISKFKNEYYNAYYRDLIESKSIIHDESVVQKKVMAMLSARGIELRKRRGEFRFFWVGASEEQDRAGFLQALSSWGEVLEFTNANHKYGLEFSGPIFHDPTVSKRNGEVLLQQVREAHQKKKIDILMGQMWANFLDVEYLQEIQKMGIVVINIAMDDRLPEHFSSSHGKLMGSVGLVAGTDLSLNTVPESCARYQAHGGNCIYWYLGSDPDIFKPSATKDIDVCFVGSKYGVRPLYVKKMQENGIQVSVFGPGWPAGLIDSKKTAEVFGRSKIVFGMGTVGYNSNVFTIKLRDFDATMAGALYITHRNPDLLKLFDEDKEIICYMSLDEAIEKIKDYLANPKLIEEMGARAAKKSRELYTWDKRIESALEFIGAINKEAK